MGNYISSRYNQYFDNQNKYNNTQREEEELLHSPLSTISGQSFDQDCPDIFSNGFLVLSNDNSLDNITNLNNSNDSNDSYNNTNNLAHLKTRYHDLLIYNSYLKLEYNNCLQDNNELLQKIEKLERQNIYFKQKIYKINTNQEPFKNRRKTV